MKADLSKIPSISGNNGYSLRCEEVKINGESAYCSYSVCQHTILAPRFYVSTSKSIIKALINMHSFEIQLSPIG